MVTGRTYELEINIEKSNMIKILKNESPSIYLRETINYKTLISSSYLEV